MKIRQLLADGQTPDLHAPETSALLFNSVYVGVHDDVDNMDADALIAAIEHELDDDFEVSSQSSWQTLVPMTSPRSTEPKSTSTQKRSLKRSKQPSIEFRLAGLSVSYDQYQTTEPFASRVLCTIRDLQILDHIKTSTWKMFLTEMRRDLRGIVRETDSDMVRIELRNVRPIAGSHIEESRLRVSLRTPMLVFELMSYRPNYFPYGFTWIRMPLIS
jgi:autophagy-related protein 2